MIGDVLLIDDARRAFDLAHAWLEGYGFPGEPFDFRTTETSMETMARGNDWARKRLGDPGFTLIYPCDSIQRAPVDFIRRLEEAI